MEKSAVWPFNSVTLWSGSQTNQADSFNSPYVYIYQSTFCPYTVISKMTILTSLSSSGEWRLVFNSETRPGASSRCSVIVKKNECMKKNRKTLRSAIESGVYIQSQNKAFFFFFWWPSREHPHLFWLMNSLESDWAGWRRNYGVWRNLWKQS